MGEWIFGILRGHFTEHGYWTVFIILLLENAGIPVPGETVLLFASFLAFSEQALNLPHLILISVLAATIGDNLGYYVGQKGGRRLLERYRSLFRISPETIGDGEKLFEKYGSQTVFFARFIFGMRIIAGPLAGVLRMPWRRFVIFNFLGAVTWVTAISLVGYFFGEHWEKLIHIVGRFNAVIGLIAAYAGYRMWRKFQHSRKLRKEAAEKETVVTEKQP